MTTTHEVLARMKANNPPRTLEQFIAAGLPVTEEAAKSAEAMTRYENRDRIPEPLLRYADLYNELTGQEPTKRVLTDWIGTFEDWKGEKLEADHIRGAWMQANSERGFPVGRPGALTTTAVGIKSKNTKGATASPAINTQAVEDTKAMIEQKTSGIFVPPPPGTRERIKAKLAQARMK